MDRRAASGEEKKRVVVVSDTREASGNVDFFLRELGARVRKKQLDVADYILSDRVGVERKEVGDLLQSITDHRIFRQVDELSESFELPVLIIEGEQERLFSERRMHPNAVRGALAHIAVDCRMPMLWTRSPEETAHQIFWIGYREQIKENRTIQVRAAAGNRTTARRQEFIVAGLPNVNSILSRRLLREFRTVRRVFESSREDMMRIRGLGEEKIRRILEIMDAEYCEDSEDAGNDAGN